MPRKKGSCLTRAMWGCGSVVALFILIGVGLTLTYLVSKPNKPEQESQSFQQTLVNYEPTFPDVGNHQQKPVKLEVDVAMARLNIIPTSGSEISVDGDYDKANFELVTEFEEKEDHLLCRVRFKNSKAFVSLLIGGLLEDLNNRVTVQLPVGIPTSVDMKLKMGDGRIDFTGIALAKLKADLTMGDMDIDSDEPNPLIMEDMALFLEAGELTVSSFQNFRSKKMHLEGSKGELGLRSNGKLLEECELWGEMTMGEINVRIPENADVDADVTVVMGEFNSRPQGEVPSDALGLKIRGSVTMGAFELRKGPPTNTLNEILAVHGVDELGQDVDAIVADLEDPEQFRSMNPGSLNSLGYRMMREGNTEKAIAVFRLNVVTHPDYANGYDSLGEALYEQGDLHEALKYYKIALDMQPGNDHASKMVRQIEGEIEASKL